MLLDRLLIELVELQIALQLEIALLYHIQRVSKVILPINDITLLEIQYG